MEARKVVYRRERKVLKPMNPIPVDNDEWPQFNLDRAIVYKDDAKNLASLLEADGGNTLTVRGFLEKVDDDQKHLGKSMNESSHR